MLYFSLSYGNFKKEVSSYFMLCNTRTHENLISSIIVDWRFGAVVLRYNEEKNEMLRRHLNDLCFNGILILNNRVCLNKSKT